MIKPLAFHALHAIYHERDFRVRVNDPTINMVRRVLAAEVGVDADPDVAPNLANCPACSAGFDFLACQPTHEDRR